MKLKEQIQFLQNENDKLQKKIEHLERTIENLEDGPRERIGDKE